MTKRQYKSGKRVKRVEELFKDQALFILVTGSYSKTYHVGWLHSLPTRVLYNYIAKGCLVALKGGFIKWNF